MSRNYHWPGRCLLLSTIVALPLVSQAQSSADGPELRLFSSSIVEDIRLTGDAAARMELDVQSSIEAMDQQLSLYKASACETAGEDAGCGEMRRQLGQTYKAMLDAMEEALPGMEDAIQRSRDGLQQTLSRQLGRQTSPTDLQSLLLDNGGTPGGAARRPSRAGGGARLSERFRQYHSLVAGSSGTARRGRGALAVTAADIYLDMEEAADLIALTRDEIGRAQIYIDIDQAMPGLTGQMESTVEGVKRILFGESDQLIGPDDPPQPLGNDDPDDPAAFQSELEL